MLAEETSIQPHSQEFTSSDWRKTATPEDIESGSVIPSTPEQQARTLGDIVETNKAVDEIATALGQAREQGKNTVEGTVTHPVNESNQLPLTSSSINNSPK